MQPSSSSICSQ